jgi:hypothetical protein
MNLTGTRDSGSFMRLDADLYMLASSLTSWKQADTQRWPVKPKSINRVLAVRR